MLNQLLECHAANRKAHLTALSRGVPIRQKRTIGRMLHLDYDAEKIVELMRAAGLSGNSLARKAGISGPSLHAILKGTTRHVKYSTLAAIAAALGVPVQVITKTRAKGKRDLQAEASIAFSQLSPSDQAAILAAMQHLVAQKK